MLHLWQLMVFAAVRSRNVLTRRVPSWVGWVPLIGQKCPYTSSFIT